MNLNQQIEKICQSSTVAIADLVLSFKAKGQKIIPLHVGDPDFDTPTAVMEVALEAMRSGLTHYGPSRGDLELRSAVANKLVGDSSGTMTYNPETEILATHGAIHGYYLAMQSILNPGDEVLIPNPSWATHTNMVNLLRGKAVQIPAPPENDFLPSIEAWNDALTPKTRAIVINYPANPTGTFPDGDYLQELHDLAEDHNLWIVSDEVYQNLYYEKRPASAGASSGAKSHTILVNSLSKTYAMTGWRVGYMAAPQQVIENGLKAGQNSITCIAPFIQKAAAFALSDEGTQEAAEEMRKAYSRRRAIVEDIAQSSGNFPFCVTSPKGAFYFFLDFRELGISSFEICERILEEEGVSLVPGSAFGENGEGFVRMTIAASDNDVENGFKKILSWAKGQVGG